MDKTGGEDSGNKKGQGTTGWPCIFCGGKFATYGDVTDHLHAVHGYFANFGFSRDQGTSPVTYQGPKISDLSLSTKKFQPRKRSNASPSVVYPRQYPCELCYMIFSTPYDRDKHKRYACRRRSGRSRDISSRIQTPLPTILEFDLNEPEQEEAHDDNAYDEIDLNSTPPREENALSKDPKKLNEARALVHICKVCRKVCASSKYLEIHMLMTHVNLTNSGVSNVQEVGKQTRSVANNPETVEIRRDINPFFPSSSWGSKCKRSSCNKKPNMSMSLKSFAANPCQDWCENCHIILSMPQDRERHERACRVPIGVQAGSAKTDLRQKQPSTCDDHLREFDLNQPGDDVDDEGDAPSNAPVS